MNLRRLATLLSVLTLSTSVACFDDKDDDDDDDEDEDEDDDSGWDTTWGTTGGTSSTAPTETASGTDPSITTSWGSTALEVDVAPTGDYWFGVTETGFSEAWTGEDCVWGYEYDGTTLAYCHGVSDGSTRLTYGGDPLNLSQGTTVFPDASFQASVTYFLESTSGGCWVWGNDPSYYDGLGCTEL